MDVIITTADIAWLAGFLEGEDTFYFPRTACVDVGQVQRWPLDKCVRLVGGKICVVQKRIHHWRLTGPRAVGVLMMVYPFLSPDRQVQIRNVLTKWRNSLASTKYRVFCKHGHNLSQGKHQRFCNMCKTLRQSTPEYRERHRIYLRSWRPQQKDEIQRVSETGRGT